MRHKFQFPLRKLDDYYDNWLYFIEYDFMFQFPLRKLDDYYDGQPWFVAKDVWFQFPLRKLDDYYTGWARDLLPVSRVSIPSSEIR